MATAINLTVSRLEQRLKELELPTTGTKGELIVRLNEADPEGVWMKEQIEEYRSNEDDARDVEVNITHNQLLRQELELTNRERDLARRELAVLERERQLQNKTNDVGVNEDGGQDQQGRAVHQNIRAGVKEIGCLLGDFNGTNRYFNEWEKQIRIIKCIYSVEEDSMKIIVTSKLKGKAKRWFRSKPDYMEMTLDALLTAMKEKFDTRANKVALLKKFESRTWQPNERFSNYYQDKSILANLVSIDEKDLVDHLIDGIPDRTLQNLARIHNFIAASDLLSAFWQIPLPADPKAPTKRDPTSGEKLAPKKLGSNKNGAGKAL